MLTPCDLSVRGPTWNRERLKAWKSPVRAAEDADIQRQYWGTVDEVAQGGPQVARDGCRDVVTEVHGRPGPAPRPSPSLRIAPGYKLELPFPHALTTLLYSRLKPPNFIVSRR